MTLFRKVFQNQGRPLDEADGIDEEALKSAFVSNETGGDPFVLDPHRHAVNANGVLNEVGEDTNEDESALADDEVSELIDAVNPPDPLVEDHQEDAPASVTPMSKGPETDEEIAAFMDRTMAEARVPAEPQNEEASAVDELEFSFLATAAKRNEADEEEMVVEPATPPKAPELDDPDDVTDTDASATPVLAHDPAPEMQDDPAEDALDLDEKTSPAASADMDVSDFARSQLASEATEGAPKHETVNPASGAAEASVADDAPIAEAQASAPVEPAGIDLSNGAIPDAIPSPAAGRAGRRAGRVKTRLLGFNREDEGNDPLGQMSDSTATPQREKFPVGWLVVVEGPGVGHAFSIFTGASMIGRGEDQMIRLDFGDTSISRHNHAAIAYDEEANKFYIGHGGKSNIIRRNARPVLSTEELHHADLLRIGETTLRFVALCGSDFQWNRSGENDAAGV